MSEYTPLGPLHLPTGALILCDTVLRDASTGKLSAINTFNSIAVSPLPGLAKLKGIAKIWGLGTQLPVSLHLTMVDRRTGELIFTTEPSDLPVEDYPEGMNDPVLDIVIELEVPIEGPGAYELRMVVGDLTAATHPLWIVAAEELDDDEEYEPMDEA